MALTSFGATFVSGCLAGLAPASTAATPGQPIDPSVAKAALAVALAAVTAMLTGLMGGVIGGWIASEQPMTIRGMPRVRIEPERRMP